MKLKITNPYIPVFLVLLALCSIILAVTTDNEAMSTIGQISSVTAGVLLMLVYFPILAISLYSDKIKNKEKIVNNIGIFSVSFIILGIIMKLFQLPGTGVVVILGCSTFYLNFLPAWYLSNFKNNDILTRILHFLFCTSIGLLIISFQFKFMRWPYGSALVTLSIYVPLFTLLPFFLYLRFFKRDKNYFSIDSKFLFGFIIAYYIGANLSMRIITGAMASNNKGQLGVEANLKLYTQKTKLLYTAFEKNKEEDSTFIKFKSNSNQLQKYSSAIFNYIRDQKAYLVNTANNESSHPDSIKFEYIRGKVNYEIPTGVLIGNDRPATGKYSAKELRDTLQSYISNIYELLPEEFQLEFKHSNPFDFSDVPLEEGDKISWEAYHFDHIPLGQVYTTLTGFQANIRYMEMIALNELYTKANSNNKENMAAQLAELSMKYETAKQEKKISLLEKDQELHNIKLEAKDAEINSKEQMMIYFVLGLIAFAILSIFVIRSNILRKQTNLELARQKEIITHQKEEVVSQKHLIEEKQKEIIDSINYAKRLQQAILATPEEINKHFPDNFLLYKPKDIVAGDFYFFETTNDHIFYAAADCTGHGVPGALVSIVCSNALTRCVKEFGLNDPGAILTKTRELVLETFAKSSNDVKDGMDISLIAYNKLTKKIKWSGANNPLWYIAHGKLEEIKADKQPIGKTDNAKPFISHDIENTNGITLYLFTDGFADQFGGPKGKKFKYKQLEELLLSNTSMTMSEQMALINNKFEEWKGKLEQVDDVCVIGIKL